jgi:hypothetical protein
VQGAIAAAMSRFRPLRRADLNKLVNSVGGGAQRLIGCGFGANSRQEFGRCILTGKLDGQK